MAAKRDQTRVDTTRKTMADATAEADQQLTGDALIEAAQLALAKGRPLPAGVRLSFRSGRQQITEIAAEPTADGATLPGSDVAITAPPEVSQVLPGGQPVGEATEGK